MDAEYCLLVPTYRHLIDETLKQFGKLDILVNNASQQVCTASCW